MRSPFLVSCWRGCMTIIVYFPLLPHINSLSCAFPPVRTTSSHRGKPWTWCDQSELHGHVCLWKMAAVSWSLKAASAEEQLAGAERKYSQHYNSSSKSDDETYKYKKRTCEKRLDNFARAGDSTKNQRLSLAVALMTVCLSRAASGHSSAPSVRNGLVRNFTKLSFSPINNRNAWSSSSNSLWTTENKHPAWTSCWLCWFWLRVLQWKDWSAFLLCEFSFE